MASQACEQLQRVHSYGINIVKPQRLSLQLFIDECNKVFLRVAEFKGNVAAVYTHPLSLGGSSGAHYNGNAETYMNVGQAMGEAMVEMIKADKNRENSIEENNSKARKVD